MATSGKPAGHASRSYLNCRFCRRDKRQCEPHDYNWEAGERCRPCIAGDKPCGPRIPHSSRDPNRASSTTFPPTAACLEYGDLLENPLPLFSTTPEDCFRFPCSQSPGVEPLLNDFPRVRKKRNSHFDASQEGRAFSVKELIRSKLIELGKQAELFLYLKDRLRAATLNFHVRGHAAHEAVKETVATILDLARNKFSDLCEEISTNIHYVSSRADKELFLRQADAKVRSFLHTATETGSREGYADDCRDIKSTHCALVASLAAACEENGDFSEAYRLKAQLSELQAQYQIEVKDGASHNPSAFMSMSGRLGEAFRSLKIPSRHAKIILRQDDIFPPAHLAVYAGCASTAQHIVDMGICDPEARDILQRQLVHIAAETGDGGLLQLALVQDEHANSSRDIYNLTALCVAAYTGKADIFQQLMEAGDDASVRDMTGRSILALASGAGHIAIVRYLLSKGYRPNEFGDLRTLGAYSALHAAAAGGHRDVVDLLLQHGASALMECQGFTPSQDARSNGHLDLATKLDEAMETEHDNLVLVPKADKGKFPYASEILADPLLASISSKSSSPYSRMNTLDDNASRHRAARSASLSLMASPQPSAVPSPAISTASRKRRHTTSHRSSPSLPDSTCPLSPHSSTSLPTSNNDP